MYEQLKELLKQLEEKEFKSIPINEAINIYIEQNQDYKRPETIRYYKDHLKPFLRYAEISNLSTTKEITNETIHKYTLYLKMQNNANTTINKRVESLIRMINYLDSINIIHKNNLTFRKLECSEKEIQIISIETLIKILGIAKNKNTYTRLIILLLISTGIRRNELVNIKINNLDLPKNRIYLEFTKSKKSRYIYTTDEINNLIKELMSHNKNNIYLFEDTSGEQMKPARVTYVIWYIKNQLKLNKLHPHLFRHSYATYLLKNGASLEDVRKLLGHTTIKMTLRYLHLSNEDLQRANNEFNVLNNIKKALNK